MVEPLTSDLTPTRSHLPTDPRNSRQRTDYRITKKAIVAGRDRRRSTPFQAKHYLATLKGLFRWAVDADLVRDDPTTGVNKPKVKNNEGFLAWTTADIVAFEKRWPIGTRERVAFDVLRYTGLRRGDAAKLGRPHVRDGVINIRTEKTGEWIAIVMQAELAATLETGPVGELTFIAGERGRPMTKESFGNFSAMRASPLASRSRRTGSGSGSPRNWPNGARPSQSLKPRSDGAADGWRHTTLGALTVGGLGWWRLKSYRGQC